MGLQGLAGCTLFDSPKKTLLVLHLLSQSLPQILLALLHVLQVSLELLEIDWHWLLLRLHVDQEALYLALNESLRGRKLGSLRLVVPGHVSLEALHPGHEFAASVSRNQLVLGFDGCQLGDDPGSHLVDLARDAWLLDGVGEGHVIGIWDNLFF